MEETTQYLSPNSEEVVALLDALNIPINDLINFSIQCHIDDPCMTVKTTRYINGGQYPFDTLKEVFKAVKLIPDDTNPEG